MNCLMMIEQMTNLFLSLSAPIETVLMLRCPFTISENSKIFFLQNPYNAVENNVTQHNAGTEIKEHNEHVKCFSSSNQYCNLTWRIKHASCRDL